MPVSGKVVSGGILGITAAFGIGVYYAQTVSYTHLRAHET